MYSQASLKRVPSLGTLNLPERVNSENLSPTYCAESHVKYTQITSHTFLTFYHFWPFFAINENIFIAFHIICFFTFFMRTFVFFWIVYFFDNLLSPKTRGEIGISKRTCLYIINKKHSSFLSLIVVFNTFFSDGIRFLLEKF